MPGRGRVILDVFQHVEHQYPVEQFFIRRNIGGVKSEYGDGFPVRAFRDKAGIRFNTPHVAEALQALEKKPVPTPNVQDARSAWSFRILSGQSPEMRSGESFACPPP